MKLKLALCALTVSGSMFMAAQQPATSSPANSTPPTFPTDQKAPAADQAQQPAIDSQSSSQDQNTQNQSGNQSSQVDAQSGSMDQGSANSNSNSKKIEGCLSQATSGSGFILTDASGVAYNLQGDSSELSSHVGQEVRITPDEASNSGSANSGSANSGSASDKSASSSSSASSAGAAGSDASASNNITVKKVKKIASSCSTSQSPASK